MEAVEAPLKRLDPTIKQKVSYCIPTWLRDEQIRLNTARVPGRLEPPIELSDEPVAVVCYGPSLSDTWEQIKGFTKILSCSGAHKFLLERGIVPTWHMDVDPRKHKIALMGEPHRDVEYLLASTCHPDYVKLLQDGGYRLRLWHIFDPDDEARRELPAGEWALTGGCSVGLRALAIARFLGYRQLDVFGMDGNEGKTGKHAAAHPNQAPQVCETEYPPSSGRIWRTTPAFLEAARQTSHELDDLRDVTARFHGDGLVQAMMRSYVRKPPAAGSAVLTAYSKPELITSEYVKLNAQLHSDNLSYGVGAGKHADSVKKIIKTLKTEDGLPPSVLDYGCGKGYLQKALPFPIYEYDPAIPGKSESARPADLVCCLDVLEHIEPDKLLYVLDDLRRCVKRIGYFVINTKAANKTLPDGRNTHLIQEGEAWWTERLGMFFTVGRIFPKGPELHAIVVPKLKKKKIEKAAALSVQALAPQVSEPSVLDFSGLQMRRDPYLIGSVSDVMDEVSYGQLAATFPSIDLFRAFGGENHKWSLSTVNNPDAYARFLSSSEPWRAFHHYIKRQFVPQIAAALKEHGVKLPNAVKARWEFSVLPADGGCLRAHTDIASKLVTVVLSMRPLEDLEWHPEWGGGTEVLKPKRVCARCGPLSAGEFCEHSEFGSQPLDDYKAEFDAFDVVHTYPYVPNQAVVFVKGPESWHGVRPMTGSAGMLRRTVTINIEKAL